MQTKQWMWLLLGMATGIGISQFWPHEPAYASATDRDERFAITTVLAQGTAGLAQTEAVFVLDFLTGRMTGALLNPQVGGFTNYFFRNVAADFHLDAGAKPRFAIIGGQAEMPSGQGFTFAPSVIYIGEMTTGKLMAYRYPIRLTRQPLPPEQLEPPFAYFQFRDASTKK